MILTHLNRLYILNLTEKISFQEEIIMPYLVTNDKVRLYYEETGSGTPVIFAHEFAGDFRSWEPQVRHFGRRYRVITYNARGYTPSDVPGDVALYSQNRAAHDIAAVLDHLGIKRAHVIGLSMGSYAALFFGFLHPARALSLTICGCGYGAEPAQYKQFQAEAERIAALILEKGMAFFADQYAYGPTRVQLENKDPRGFAEFKRILSSHSAAGSANTMLGCQKKRPSLYALTDQLKALNVPTLIMTGDEDWPCLLPAVLLKQNIPASAIAVMPNCGHTINLEEPDKFNAIIADFLAQVDSGRWPIRDPRAMIGLK